SPGGTPITITPVLRIWTRTGAGRMCPTTAMYGFRTSTMTGLRIVTATGLMSPTMAGPGLATNLGAGRHITTDAGSGTATRGLGGRDRRGVGTVRSGRLRMCRSGAAALALDLDGAGVVGAASAGSRSDLATGSIRGGVDTAAGLARSASVADLVVSAASHLCMEE